MIAHPDHLYFVHAGELVREDDCVERSVNIWSIGTIFKLIVLGWNAHGYFTPRLAVNCGNGFMLTFELIPVRD